MTPKQRIQALLQAIAPNIKALIAAQGDLATLTTTEKANLVGAINELQTEIQALVSGGSAVIDDTATDGNTTATYSADKILELYAALKAEILGPDTAAALDTIKELATELLAQDATLDNLLTLVGNGVRFTEQVLSPAQQLQVRSNIGGASQADLTELRTEFDVTEAQVAELDYDFAQEYILLRDA